MNTPHEPPVNVACCPPPDRHATPQSPESPPPVGEQAVTFQTALLAFKSGCAGKGLREPRRTQLESMLLVALRAEQHWKDRAEQHWKDETGCTLPRCTATGMKTLDLGNRFVEWARDNADELSIKLIREVWGCSRATAYRRYAGALHILQGT